MATNNPVFLNRHPGLLHLTLWFHSSPGSFSVIDLPNLVTYHAGLNALPRILQKTDEIRSVWLSSLENLNGLSLFPFCQDLILKIVNMPDIPIMLERLKNLLSNVKCCVVQVLYVDDHGAMEPTAQSTLFEETSGFKQLESFGPFTNRGLSPVSDAIMVGKVSHSTRMLLHGCRATVLVAAQGLGRQRRVHCRIEKAFAHTLDSF
ncbi:hypothetical protein C8J56DRAFT_210432 [Mycena floridula]|nr:hypothetical protein C8J56DRAFT_210432 [Mycena floridula]